MKRYTVSDATLSVLQNGKILAPNETPQDLFQRVVTTISQIESTWNYTSQEIAEFSDAFAHYFLERAFVLGSPTLTNAGRADHLHSALSSCVVIPVDLNHRPEAQEKIISYYKQNMGSGFDFTPYSDPVELLNWLNTLAASETATNTYDRYIGNMGNLHVSHPKVSDFIQAKRDTNLRHFNISVDVTTDFMDAALADQQHTFADGTKASAAQLLHEMAEGAWINGDPGIIFLERMNADNPVADISPYVSTPPCSEMGLAAGETCQFGYLNVSYFVDTHGQVRWEELEKATRILTRALDNAIEVSLAGFPDPLSVELAEMKRKIGISICGVADALLKQLLPYDSDAGRNSIRNILSFITYVSKVESHELALRRGSCNAMQIKDGNKYYDGYLSKRYGKGTDIVSGDDWKLLSDKIQQTGHLRNILTTALPPSGRSSILLGVTSSLEPIFAASQWNEDTARTITAFLERQVPAATIPTLLEQAREQNSFQNLPISNKGLLKTAKEIHPHDHVKMVAAVAGHDGVCDETVSKTVNVAHSATVEDILDIFRLAHVSGLKNISVYRDGTHLNQPQKL